jgi:hypothetical protein
VEQPYWREEELPSEEEQQEELEVVLPIVGMGE